MLQRLPVNQRIENCSASLQCVSFRSSKALTNRQSAGPISYQSSARSNRRSTQAVAAAQTEQDPQVVAVPYGYYWYETMILLRSDLDAEKRDVELAKFEAFLKKEGAVQIDALVRSNSQALAYPIKGFWDGIYVLYTYAANPQTARKTQKVLSTPAVGEESNILRHMTFKQ